MQSLYLLHQRWFETLPLDVIEPHWNPAFEALTVPTESGQVFDMAGGERKTQALKGALFSYSAIKNVELWGC